MFDKIVLASGNQGKIREFNHLLSDLGCHVVAQGELGVQEVPETGSTFVENAIIKARNAAKVTGLPALADDSGLVVQALHGAPGIYSSRYAGSDATDESNIDKLLSELAEQTQHSAYLPVYWYLCVMQTTHRRSSRKGVGMTNCLARHGEQGSLRSRLSRTGDTLPN